MSTLKVNNLQVGQDSTATNNLTWFQPGSPDGTIRLGSGNAGSATTKFTFDKDGNLTCVGNINAASILAPIEGTLDDWIVHAGDTNTQFGFPGNDQFQIDTSGTPRLKILSGGVVLFGNTTSQEVYGTNAVQIQGTSGPTSSMSLVRHGNSPYLTLGSSGGNALGAVTALSANNRIGQITFAGADGNDINTHSASIAAYVDGSVSTDTVPGRLVFATSTGASELERMRIDSSGRLLLGTGAIALPKGSGAGSFDLDSGSITMCVGGNVNSTGRTNSTDKLNRITSPHYTNAEEPVMLASSYNVSGNNTLSFGGGSSLCNAATQILFYTAASTTTTSGDERLKIKSDGKIIVPTTGKLSLGTSSPVAQFTCGTANGSTVIEIQGTDGVIRGYNRNSSAWSKIEFEASNYIFDTGGSPRLNITSTGNLEQNGGSGISYFKGSGEYIFGSNLSSPPAGGSEAGVQIHSYKTRAHLSINAYMNNSGGPFMQFVSSRSGTLGTLGSKVQNNDYIGEIRFMGDNGTNYNSLCQGASIYAQAASTPADGDTTIGGELYFTTGTGSAGSQKTRLTIDAGGRVIIGRSSHGGGGALVVCGTSDTPNAYACASFCKIGANPTSGTTLTNLRFSGGSGGTSRAAEINVKCDANWSEGSSHASKMELGVVDSGATGVSGPSLTLKAGGDVEINRGNLVMANDKGISFINADDVASGETVAGSVLDDYEEGTYAPTISNLGNHTASSNTEGSYTKIGDTVTVRFRYFWTSRSTTNGAYSVTVSLPFTGSSIKHPGGGYLAVEGCQPNASDRTSYHCTVPQSQAYVLFRCSGANVSENSFNGGISTSLSSGYFIGVVSYKTT